MNDPGFPVFDADNHLYENPAWLDYLPKRYAATSSSSRCADAHDSQ